MVNMGELFANPRLINVEMDRVTLSTQERNSSLLADGDLLFARQSLVLAGAGKCSIFVGDVEDVCFESHVIRCRLNQQLADPHFYFYFFSSFAGRRLIETIVEQGAGASGIRGSDLAELAVPWVDPAVQRRAAAVLRQMDDKIAVNRRINQTLEAMAQTIFESWFVDFDPVKAKIAAKAEGRNPLRAAMSAISGKADAELDALPPEQHAQIAANAALFPDEMVDSDLGKVPRGWTATQIGKVTARVAMGPFGSDIRKENFVDAGVPVIRGGNLTDGLVENNYVFLTEAKADALKSANAFPGDIVVTHRGTLGQVGLIPERSKFPRYVVSQSQMLLSVNRAIMSPRYLFEFLRSEAGKQQLLSNTSQVGVPAIARPTGSVKALPLVAPPRPVLDAYESALKPMLHGLTHLVTSSETLAALRDALLPKLLSGELQVQNIEAEAAA
jgi:type I restriction enzyme S subunit